MNARDFNIMQRLKEENAKLLAEIKELRTVAGNLPEDLNYYPVTIMFASQAAKDEFVAMIKKAKPNLTLRTL